MEIIITPSAIYCEKWVGVQIILNHFFLEYGGLCLLIFYGSHLGEFEIRHNVFSNENISFIQFSALGDCKMPGSQVTLLMVIASIEGLWSQPQ